MTDPTLDAVEAVRAFDKYPLWVLACAQRFHDTYEAIAPKHGYVSRVAWHELDDNLRALMCETVRLVIGVDPTEPYAQVAALTADRERLQAALGEAERERDRARKTHMSDVVWHEKVVQAKEHAERDLRIARRVIEMMAETLGAIREVVGDEPDTEIDEDRLLARLRELIAAEARATAAEGERDELREWKKARSL